MKKEKDSFTLGERMRIKGQLHIIEAFMQPPSFGQSLGVMTRKRNQLLEFAQIGFQIKATRTPDQMEDLLSEVATNNLDKSENVKFKVDRICQVLEYVAHLHRKNQKQVADQIKEELVAKLTAPV